VRNASGHPWFVGCQFHPEFTSNDRTAFVAALTQQGN
jgi:CTP synthase (UTP-ammonia lyase)